MELNLIPRIVIRVWARIQSLKEDMITIINNTPYEVSLSYQASIALCLVKIEMPFLYFTSIPISIDHQQGSKISPLNASCIATYVHLHQKPWMAYFIYAAKIPHDMLDENLDYFIVNHHQSNNQQLTIH